MMSGAVELSIVIPIYNEEENIEPLLSELFPVVRDLKRTFEVICVNDASTDKSISILNQQMKQYPELRIVSHSINCGESAAEATGFAAAQGSTIVTIDGDQQNDPADIPLLLQALSDNADAACGVRRKREDDWVKRLSSRIANSFRNWVTGDNIYDAGCTFRALRKSALAEIPVFNGMHRFLPTILRLQGYTVKELLVNHRPRTRGQSKYGIGNRMFRGLVDCFAMRWFGRRCLPCCRIQIDNKKTLS